MRTTGSARGWWPAVLRRRRLVLVVWAACFLVPRRGVVGDWAFHRQGAAALLGPDPLGLYERHPQLQIGPAALLAAVPLRAAPALVVQIGLWALGLLALALAERAWPAEARRHPERMLLAGMLAVPCWSFVVTSGHLDDALAITATVGAASLLARSPATTRTALGVGALLGLAVAAKPWALPLVALALGLSGLRTRLQAVAAALVVATLAWGPFVLAAPGTPAALGSFRIPVAATSGLRLLGVDGGAAFAGWVRPAQLFLALALAAVALRRGRWWAVPAVALAARVALDPGSVGYYAAAVALAAVLADGHLRPRVPLAVAAVAAGLFYPAFLALLAAGRGEVVFASGVSAVVVAGVRVAACAVLVAVVLLVPCCAVHPSGETGADSLRPGDRPADAPEVVR